MTLYSTLLELDILFWRSHRSLSISIPTELRPSILPQNINLPSPDPISRIFSNPKSFATRIITSAESPMLEEMIDKSFHIFWNSPKIDLHPLHKIRTGY